MKTLPLIGLILSLMLLTGCMTIASMECSGLCKEQGHLNGKCRKALDPIPELCWIKEVNIGPAASCVTDENMIAARATCCCTPKPVIENKTTP